MKKYIIITVALFTVFSLQNCDKKSLDSFSSAAGGTTGTGGSMARFTIVGNYLYTVDKQNLKVFDITNPSTTAIVNTVPVGFEIETIYPFKNRLFIGSSSQVHIFNIDNPTQPVKLSVAISPTVLRRCDPVVAKDSVAYATLRTNGPCGGIQSTLATYDIRDINNPIQRDADIVGEPYGLGYQDNVLYVCDRNGLSVYNIANQYNPSFVQLMNQNEWYFDVIPVNNYLYGWVSNGLMVYNITNRLNPVFIKKII